MTLFGAILLLAACGPLAPPASAGQAPATALQLSELKRAAFAAGIKWTTLIKNGPGGEIFLTQKGAGLIERYEKKHSLSGPFSRGARPTPIGKLENLALQKPTAENLSSFYDGGVAGAGDSGKKPTYDISLVNGYPSVSFNQKHASEQFGYLFADGLSPYAAPSPYANVRLGADGYGRVDYHVRGTLGLVRVSADYPVGPPLPAQGLENFLGSGADQYLRYGNAPQSADVVVASLDAAVGRAYKTGPLALFWGFNTANKFEYALLNSGIAGTGGVELPLPGGRSLQAYIGESRDYAMVNPDAVQSFVFHQGNGAPVGIFTGKERSVGIAYVDPSDGLAALVSHGGGTSLASENAQVSLTKGRFTLGASVEKKAGRGIEYGETDETGQAGYRLGRDTVVSIGYQSDKLQYGNAVVNAKGWFARLSTMFGPAARISAEQFFGAQSQSTLQDKATGAFIGFSSAAGGALDRVQSLIDHLASNLQSQELTPDQLRQDIIGISDAVGGSPELAAQIVAAARQARLSGDQEKILSGILLAGVPPDNPYYLSVSRVLGRPVPLSSLVSNLLALQGNLFLPVQQAVGNLALHKNDLERTLKTLRNQTLWQNAVADATRTMIFNSLGDLNETVNVLGRPVALKLDAPTLIPLAGIAINAGVTPLAPITPEQTAQWILQKAAGSLGIAPGNASAQAVSDAFFAQAQQQLAQMISRDGSAGALNPAALADQIQRSLPPPLADYLRQKYGAGLSNYIAALAQEPQELASRLISQIKSAEGAQVTSAVNNGFAAAGEIISRQVNQILATSAQEAKEFDKLTADGGAPADVQGMEAAMDSFARLNGQGKKTTENLTDAISGQTRTSVAALALRQAQEQITASRADVRSMQASPQDWPSSLTVSVDPRLAAYYGRDGIHRLVQGLADIYRSLGSVKKLNISVMPGSYMRSVGTWNQEIDLPAPASPDDASGKIDAMLGAEKCLLAPDSPECGNAAAAPAQTRPGR
ncbi:MAG: hypothetical protein KGL04_05580 [Elusimicrobia bacterium]|nr:hypothetical protein [Elusimicrobiota bacterium]